MKIWGIERDEEDFECIKLYHSPEELQQGGIKKVGKAVERSVITLH